jgi:hypothetical protein
VANGVGVLQVCNSTKRALTRGDGSGEIRWMPSTKFHEGSVGVTGNQTGDNAGVLKFWRAWAVAWWVILADAFPTILR